MFSVDKYRDTKVRAGYTISGTINCENYSFLSFHKLSFKNENFLMVGEDFVAVMGTMVYNKTIGSELLNNLYADFSGDICEVRNKSLGSYCVIIKKNNELYIFGEENYLYNIYFYGSNDTWIISNSFLDINQVCDNKLQIDKYNLLELAFNTYVLNNETIFNGVKRLCGNEYLRIDLNTCMISTEEINIQWGYNIQNDYRESVTKFSQKLIETTRTICDAFGSPAICMTGGLDSRISIASILRNNVKPSLYYGVGNSILTDTKDMDLKINQIYSKKFGLPLSIMDWSTSLPLDDSWKLFLERYSESFMQYNASICILTSLEQIPNQYMTFGYFGELYRNISWIENLKSGSFTLDEYIDSYFMKCVSFDELVKSTNVSYGDFRTHIKNKFLVLCDRYKLDPDNISVDEYRYLYLEYLRLGCSIMLNLINKMRYCSYLISEDDVYKNSTIKCEDTKGAKFMLDSLENIYRDVLDIPFFTHCELRSYNPKKKHLDPPKSETLKKITNKSKFIVKYIPRDFKLWVLRTFVTHDSKAAKDETSNKFINDMIDKYVSNSGIAGLQFKPFTHRNYIHLSMILFALNKR